MKLICVEYINRKTGFDVIWLNFSSIYETKIISEIIKNKLSTEVEVYYYIPKAGIHNRKKIIKDIDIKNKKELRNYCLDRTYKNKGLEGIARLDIKIPEYSINIIKKVSKIISISGYPGYYLVYTNTATEKDDFYFIDGIKYKEYERNS